MQRNLKSNERMGTVFDTQKDIEVGILRPELTITGSELRHKYTFYPTSFSRLPFK